MLKDKTYHQKQCFRARGVLQVCLICLGVIGAVSVGLTFCFDSPTGCFVAQLPGDLQRAGERPAALLLLQDATAAARPGTPEGRALRARCVTRCWVQSIRNLSKSWSRINTYVRLSGRPVKVVLLGTKPKVSRCRGDPPKMCSFVLCSSSTNIGLGPLHPFLHSLEV